VPDLGQWLSLFLTDDIVGGRYAIMTKHESGDPLGDGSFFIEDGVRDCRRIGSRLFRETSEIL
jgi:hypothetical protein